jgi:heat shock protein HslJ
MPMKTLTWTWLLPAGLLVACATASPPPTLVTSANAAKLQNRQWELKSITLDSRQVVMDVQANMTLVFAADGKVMGYAAVNRFNGTCSFSPDGKLSWPGPGFVTTRKAGPPELMEKERAYLQALPKTDRAILIGNALRLQSEDESTSLMFLEAGKS